MNVEMNGGYANGVFTITAATEGAQLSFVFNTEGHSMLSVLQAAFVEHATAVFTNILDAIEADNQEPNP